MKGLGVSQTERAARMKTSRSAVSKAQHGGIDLAFASAVHFAKALRLDFFPQFVQPATGEFYARTSYQHFSAIETP